MKTEDKPNNMQDKSRQDRRISKIIEKTIPNKTQDNPNQNKRLSEINQNNKEDNLKHYTRKYRTNPMTIKKV